MIVLVVHFKVRQGTQEECIGFMRAMEEQTRREPGCRQYVGHQSTEDSQRFMFYEVYDDQAALDAHRAAPYFKQYVSGGIDTLLESRSRELYNTIG
ncbi:MAG TPA: putative quinol monooxygenase [Terriglobales bacterium]|jgi:quinol monooxygenase YgiN|nr:putative quinol monooxygenase [Terriglobales bacterium]